MLYITFLNVGHTHQALVKLFSSYCIWATHKKTLEIVFCYVLLSFSSNPCGEIQLKFCCEYFLWRLIPNSWEVRCRSLFCVVFVLTGCLYHTYVCRKMCTRDMYVYVYLISVQTGMYCCLSAVELVKMLSLVFMIIRSEVCKHVTALNLG